MRAVVVGASSGLGRCIGVGLGQRGAQVALLARRVSGSRPPRQKRVHGTDRVRRHRRRLGDAAIEKAAADLGGIDALVYTPADRPARPPRRHRRGHVARTFDTNVTGAAIVTAAAIPHLTASRGTAIYLSSVSASHTPPWPGLGAYAVSKAALDKLIDAWRIEHPTVGFTRCIVGDTAGGEGDSMTGFADDWDWDLAAELHPIWTGAGDDHRRPHRRRGPRRSHRRSPAARGASVSIPSITVTPRPPVDEDSTLTIDGDGPPPI